MSDALRPSYDFALDSVASDVGSRGRVFRAVPAGARVLDVGCDTGRFGEALIREKGCEVHGIERDPSAAREAARRLHQVHVRNLDAEDAFADVGEFDVVLFLDVLEHLYDPWSVLRRAHGVLRAGGSVVAVVPNVAHVSVVRRLMRGEFTYEQHGTMDRTHLRWFTRQSFARSLAEAGFVSATVDVIPLVPRLQDLPRIGRPLAEGLARILPDQFGGSLLGTGFRADAPAPATTAAEG